MRKSILLLFIIVCTEAVGQISGSKQIDSLLQLAYRYLSGPERDDVKAFEKYMQCAQLGHAKSMNTVGNMYKRGRGVKANGNEAARWFQQSGQAGYAHAWYNLGLHYKGMKPPYQDFETAYGCFLRGALDGDSLSEFMHGYMLYKGLGCNQDYSKATDFFRRAANRGVSNGMYFLGLSYRNGYGLEENEDSARFWLQMAEGKQNFQAKMELSSIYAENDQTEAKELARQIINAAMPSPTTPMNKYQRIEDGVESGIITGKYTGHLVKYDWSGKHVIGVSPLMLEIYGQDGSIYGIWTEGDSLRVPLSAKVSSRSIDFSHTAYSRTDYYSPKTPVVYNFESAKIQWVLKGDTVFLAGNVHLYSPLRNEPHKPISIALIKTGKGLNNDLIKFSDINFKEKKPDKPTVYPNPFKTVLTVDFELKEKNEVVTELVTIDGKIVYSNRAGKLEAGHYTLPLLPQHLSPGVYLLVLKQGKKSQTIKVIKE